MTIEEAIHERSLEGYYDDICQMVCHECDHDTSITDEMCERCSDLMYEITMLIREKERFV